MNTTNDQLGLQDFIFNDEPWDESVDGETLLCALTECLSRFVVLGHEQIFAIALWIVHSYLIRSPDQQQVFEHSPILCITSPEKQCGKSTLREVIALLVHEPLSCMNASTAALFRTIDAKRPTLLVDEFDNFGKDRSDLIAILNSGYQTDGVTLRQGGKNYETTIAFSTWCAKVLAGIGRLTDTLESRSIVIKMRRKLPGESVQSRNAVMRQDPLYFVTLRRKIVRFVVDHEASLVDMAYTPPVGIDDRQQDNWSGLLKLARFAGDSMHQHALNACMALCRSVDEQPSLGVALLQDISDYIEGSSFEFVATRALLDHLNSLDDRPWMTLTYQGLTGARLAHMLSAFDIHPHVQRDEGAPTRGYSTSRFDEAIRRYLRR